MADRKPPVPDRPSPAPKATMELLAREVRETNRGVKKIGEGQARLEAQMEGVDKRVDKVEKAISNGHGCTQQERLVKGEAKQEALEDKVTQDIIKGVGQKGEITAATKKVEKVEEEFDEYKKTGRSTRLQVGLTAIGLIITILGGVGAAIWYGGSMDATVRIDRDQNTKVHKTLETGVKTNGKAIQAIGKSVNERLTGIETTLKNGGDKTPFEKRYARMSKAEKARLKRSLPPELRYTLPEDP